jgi:hypothetical protein
MLEPIITTEPIINPQRVQWKFFNLDESGNIICLNDKPDDKEAVSIINTSLWFGRKQDTPQDMKRVISRILNQDLDGRKPNLCIAVPCEPLEIMRRYYGKDDFDGIEDDYVSIRMHDDLRNGELSFFGNATVASMPAKKGAEQIASAIENGFSIWACSGGNTLFPKLQLCEKYFAQKAISTQEDYATPKTYIVGFSNVSNAQFYLRGLINPIHYFGVFKSAIGDEEMHKTIIKALEGEQELYFQRIMNSDNIKEVSDRYNDIVQSGDEITNITFFPHSLNLSCDASFPKFKDNEKIILGLEGYNQTRVGCNVHEALFKAFEVGAIDPKKVLFISIEDIIRMDEEFEVERFNGLIPRFDELSSITQDKITAIATKLEITPEQYIEESNKITQIEIERVKEVARQFEIPVVEGGERRAGHSKNPIIQPSRVYNLEFRENGEIIQTSTFAKEAKEALFVDVRKASDCPAPDWTKLTIPSIYNSGEALFCPAKNYEYSKNNSVILPNLESEMEVRKAKLNPLNRDISNDLVEENIVAGTTLNIAEITPGEISGKGILTHVIHRGSLVNQVAELYQLLESNQMQAAKFVIISFTNPVGLSDDNLKEFMDYRFNLTKKLFEDMNIDKPVFVTTNILDQNKLSPIFSAQVNIKEMVIPSPLTQAIENNRIMPTQSEKVP